MTRKRYLAVAGMLAALVGAGFGVSLLMPPRPGVTKANYDRIHEGMTIAEVEEILGAQAKIESGLEPYFDDKGKVLRRQYAKSYWEDYNQTFGMVVNFDDNGRVVRKSHGTNPRSLFERIRRWLRL